jgi:hypothetical protein
MIFRASRLFCFGLIAVAPLSVACSSSTSSSSSGDGGTSTGGAVSPGGSCTAPMDECTLLTLSEADVAIGGMADGGAPGTMGPGNASLSEPASGDCSWSAGNATLSLIYVCGLVSTSSQGVKTGIASQIGAGSAVAVPGLGDAASWTTTGSSTLGADGGTYSGGLLTVVSNNLELNLTLQGEGTNAELEARAVAAAKIVLPRLF